QLRNSQLPGHSQLPTPNSQQLPTPNNSQRLCLAVRSRLATVRDRRSRFATWRFATRVGTWPSPRLRPSSPKRGLASRPREGGPPCHPRGSPAGGAFTPDPGHAAQRSHRSRTVTSRGDPLTKHLPTPNSHEAPIGSSLGVGGWESIGSWELRS